MERREPINYIDHDKLAANSLPILGTGSASLGLWDSIRGGGG